MVKIERYTGQPLRDRPHLAVLVYDKPGNFCVATVLLRGLREKFPGCAIDFFAGERTREFEEASPLIDARYSLLGGPGTLEDLCAFVARRRNEAGPYDLAINVDFDRVLMLATTLLAPRYAAGKCYQSDLRTELPMPDEKLYRLYADNHWNSPDFLDRYGDIVSSSFLGELWCRLAFVETDYFRYEVPSRDPGGVLPDVLISTGASRSAKLWPVDYWVNAITSLESRGFSVGLLGAPPKVQAEFYDAADADAAMLGRTGLVDLRGRFTLPEVAGALARARGCITIDNGIMHVAAASNVPTIALFGASPWRVWDPRSPNVRLLFPTVECTLCDDNRFKNAHCLRERHVCMEDIPPGRVLEELLSLIATRPTTPTP